MLEHALLYARGGFPVFPLGVGRKEPAIPSWEGGRGHLDATTDEAQIQAWWEANPTWNIGIRPPEGVLVLDIDPRNGGSIEALGILPATLCTFTPTGGRHLYYGYRGPHRKMLAGFDGIDLKSHTGYLVAPPSIHPGGGRYEWACKRAVAPLPGRFFPAVMPEARKSYVRDPNSIADVEPLVHTVLAALEGERNNTFHWAVCRAVEEGSDIGALEEAALSIGLTPSEVAATVRSAGGSR